MIKKRFFKPGMNSPQTLKGEELWYAIQRFRKKELYWFGLMVVKQVLEDLHLRDQLSEKEKEYNKKTYLVWQEFFLLLARKKLSRKNAAMFFQTMDRQIYLKILPQIRIILKKGCFLEWRAIVKKTNDISNVLLFLSCAENQTKDGLAVEMAKACLDVLKEQKQ